MTLQDIFDALNAGELRLNFVGDDENGVSDSSNKKKLISLIKRGLTALHTRFDLRIKQYTVPVIDTQEVYTLDTILVPDLLKIERILVDESLDSLVLQPLNQKQNKFSYQLLDYRTIRLPAYMEKRPNEFIVEYRADHPTISEDALYDSPDEVVIELPQSFIEPLSLYVATKVHAGNGAADGIDMASTLQAQYEIACQKLEAFNMDNDQLEWRDAIYEDGWV